MVNGFSGLWYKHPGQKFEQGCFALSIFAHHTDPFPGLDGDVKVFDQIFTALVSEIQITRRQGAFSGKRTGSKRKIKQFHLVELFFFFHFFECLDARLYHISESCLGSKTGDELLNLLAAAFIIDPGFFIDLFVLGNLIVIFGRIT